MRRDYDSDDGGAGGGQAGMQFNRHLGFRVEQLRDNFSTGELLGPKLIFVRGLVKYVTAVARLQGGPSGHGKPPVDLDLTCSVILPGQ